MEIILSWLFEMLLDLIKGLVVAFVASKLETWLRQIFTSIQNKMILRFA
jgi:hypothetical protein